MGGKQYVKAVDGVSLEINKGETFGLVGESGCGKSTLERTLIRMYDITDGKVTYKGKERKKLSDLCRRNPLEDGEQAS